MADFQQASKGFFWNHLGRIVEYFLIYLFTILIARTLGSATNGIYALFISIIQLLLLLSSFGMETAVVSLLPKQSTDPFSQSLAIRSLLVIRVGCVLGCGLLLFLFSDIFSKIFNIPIELSGYFVVIFLYFGFQSIISFLSIVLLSKFQTKVPSLVKISVRGVELVSAFILIEQGFGLTAILILLSITSGLSMLGLFVISKPQIIAAGTKNWFAGNARLAIKPFLTFGGLIWLNGMLEFILSKQTDIFLLNHYFNDPAIIGQYDVATNFGQLINFGLTTGMYGISVASFSSLAHSKPALLPGYWHFLNKTVLLVLIPAFIVCCSFADSLIPLIYSNAYFPSIILFQVFAVFLLTTRILGGGIAADYIQSITRPSVLLISSGISGAVNLALAVILIPKFGALGAIFATGAGMVTIAAIHGYFVCRALNVSFEFSFASKLIIASVFIVWLSRQVLILAGLSGTISLLVATGFLFLLVVVLVKPLRNEDLKFFGALPPQLMKWIQMISSDPSEYQGITDRQKWAFAWMPESTCTIDIGSSVSPLLAVLPLKSKQIIAVDIDRSALMALKKSNPNITVIESAASEIPIESETCDTALLLDVLEHVDDEAGTLAEAWRILKPNGTLILSVPHKGLFEFLDPQNLKARLTKKYSDQNRHRHYSETDLRDLFGKRFQILRKHYGGLFLYPLTFAGNNFFKKRLGVDFGGFFRKVGDLDNDISWGTLSYNLIVMAQKT